MDARDAELLDIFRDNDFRAIFTLCTVTALQRSNQTSYQYIDQNTKCNINIHNMLFDEKYHKTMFLQNLLHTKNCYRCMPAKTMILKGETVPIINTAEDRIKIIDAFNTILIKTI